MFCENCGAEIKEGNQFCTNCGTKVTELTLGEFNKKIDQGIFDGNNISNTGTVDIGLTQFSDVNDNNQFNTGTNQFNTGTNQFNTGTNQFDTSTNQFYTNTNQFDTGTNAFFNNSGQWGVVEEKPKKKKKGLVVFLVLLLLLLLAGGGFAGYWFFLRQTPINPEDFISVKVDKTLDGYASADVNINYNKLSNQIGYKNLKNALVDGMSTSELKDYQKEKNFNIDNATDTKAGKEALNAENIIKITIGNTDNLSNGDEITFVFEPADILNFKDNEELFKALKIKMDDKYVYKVSGLEKGREVDILIPNVENYISYVGTEGAGSAIINFDNQKYQFDNNYEVTLNGDTGTVLFNNSSVGRLTYGIFTKEGDSKQGELSKGDNLSLMVIPDEKLTQHFIEEKISAKGSKELVVGELGSYADPSTISSQQLVAISENLLIDFRNQYTEGCPDVAALYSMKNKKNPDDYYLGYLIKTTDKQNYFYYNQVYKAPDGTVVFGETPNTLYLGNSDKDLQNKLSDFDLTSINESPIKASKYAVGKYITTTAKGINIRTGPSVDYAKFKINNKDQAYEEGERMKVLDEARDSDGDLWYKVEFTRSGKQYQQWITGKYVTIDTNNYLDY